MPAGEDFDIPTLKELSRIMMDFREEWRADKAQMVRKDVHQVEHESLLARLGRAEGDLKRLEGMTEARDKERTTLRNQYYFSVVGAVLSLVVALVVGVVK